LAKPFGMSACIRRRPGGNHKSSEASQRRAKL